MTAGRALFAEVFQQMLRQAAVVLGQRHDAPNAGDVVGFALEKTLGQTTSERLPIGRLLQAPIALPNTRGLNDQIALLFEVIQGGNDPPARLAELPTGRIGVQ